MPGLKITIHGETPSKKNSRITLRNGMTIPSKRYREWHKKAREDVFVQCLAQSNGSGFALPIEKCRVAMTFWHGDLRRRDSDNGATSVLDLLTDCGIIRDDNWRVVRRLLIENEYDKGNARVEVEILEAGDGD